jgi:hypothetical protein
MRMGRGFGVLVLLIVALSGCTKTKCEITCTNSALSRTEDGGCNVSDTPQLVAQGCSAEEKESGPFD